MEMINLQIQIFLLLALGYFLGRKQMISGSTRVQLTNLVMNVVLPAAIIRSFQMELTKEMLIQTLVVLVLSIVIQFFYVYLNKFIWRGVPDAKERMNLKYGTVVNNAGTMGMVIAEAAFGEEGLLFASVFMIPVRIMMWTYGLSLYGKDRQKRRRELLKQVLLHPCIVAIYIGIALMLLQSNGILVPAFAQKTLNAVANCNTALIMIVIGTILSEVSLGDLFDKWTIIYSIVRLIALPALLFVILKLLPIPALPVNVCIIEAAMPAPSTMAMLAQKYDADPHFASKMIFVSTLGSLFTLPIWTWIFSLVA